MVSLLARRLDGLSRILLSFPFQAQRVGLVFLYRYRGPARRRLCRALLSCHVHNVSQSPSPTTMQPRANIRYPRLTIHNPQFITRDWYFLGTPTPAERSCACI